MEKKFLTFALSPEQMKYKKILSKDFLELDVWAISDIDPNRNRTHFTLASMQEALPTFKNKPILGYFERGDFVEHNGRNERDRELEKIYWNNDNGERILGFIRESDTVEIVQKDDGLNWIHFTCVLCVRYCYKQAKRILLDRSKKVSVEVEITDSYIREDGIEEIRSFVLGGVTILGSKNGKPVLEGIPGAEATCMVYKLDDMALEGQKQVLCYAYQEMDKALAVNTKQTNKEERTVDDKQLEVHSAEEVPADEEGCCKNACDEGAEVNCNSSECDDVLCKNGADGEGCAEMSAEGEGACLAAGEPCATNAEPCQNSADDGKCCNMGEDCGCEGGEAPAEEDYKLKFTECEQKLAACEEKLAACEEKLAACEEKLTACGDYEELKAKLEKAECKLFEIHCGEMKQKAMSLMASETISEEDRRLIETKCSEGKYSSDEDMEKDIAFAIFKARPARVASGDNFAVDVVVPETNKKNVSAKSRKEKIADYAQGKKF